MPVAFSLRTTPRRHLYVYPNILLGTYVPLGRCGMRGGGYDVVTVYERPMRDGEEPWYKFIFVPNFHALTETPTLASQTRT